MLTQSRPYCLTMLFIILKIGENITIIIIHWQQLWCEQRQLYIGYPHKHQVHNVLATLSIPPCSSSDSRTIWYFFFFPTPEPKCRAGQWDRISDHRDYLWDSTLRTCRIRLKNHAFSKIFIAIRKCASTNLLQSTNIQYHQLHYQKKALNQLTSQQMLCYVRNCIHERINGHHNREDATVRLTWN